MVQVLTGQSAGPPGLLGAVHVDGTQLYKPQAVVEASGLSPRQKISPALIEEARQRLVATELFDDVVTRYRYSQGTPALYDLSFMVKEAQPLFPMRFERLGGVKEADLRVYLQSHVPLYADRIPGTEGVLKRYAAAIQQFVSQSSPNLKVKGHVSNEDPRQLVVWFTSTAPAPVISRVTVTGNEAIDTGTLLRAVNLTAVGQPVSDARLQTIMDGAIRPIYAAKGFAAVTFPKIDTEPSPTDRGLIVHVTIKEGPQFKFGPLRFRGQGLEEEEIRSNISFKPGQVYDSAKADDFRLNLVHRMKRRGLLDADITLDAVPDESKRLVNITYNVNPGAVYRFDNLEIRGLDVVSEPAMRKLWGEKPGQPFNPDYPEFFLKRIEDDNLFEHLGSTRSDYTADAGSHRVTVRLYFKGGESKQDEKRRKQEEEDKRNAPPAAYQQQSQE